MGRDINNGPELYKAYQAQQAWREKSKEQKKTAYKSVAKSKADRVKPERTIVYVAPFNTTKTGIYFQSRGLAAAQTGAGSGLANILRGILGARVLYDPPTAATDTILIVPKYTFAHLKLTEKVGDTYEAKSRMTDIPYPGQRTNSVSSPFGKITGDDNYQDAIQTIRDSAAMKAFVSAKVGNKFYFQPEG